MTDSKDKSDVIPNVYDVKTLETTLQDEIKYFLTEKKSHATNNNISNLKIFIGLILISLALLAQFYPHRYPLNKNVLIFCCVTYHIISSILYVYDKFYIRDIIYESRVNKYFKQVLVVRASPIVGMTMDVSFETKNTQGSVVKTTLDITKYFCSDGTFLKDILRNDLRDLHNKWDKSD